MKIFNLKRMLGLLAIGGAVAYARSRKIDVLGKLGLRKGATPNQPGMDQDRDSTAKAGLRHDTRPDNAVTGVGASRTPGQAGSSYSGFGSSGNDFGTNRPR